MDLTKLDEEKLLEETRNLTLNEFETVLDQGITSDIGFYEKLLGLQRNLYWKAQDLQKVKLLTGKIIDLVRGHPDGTVRQQSSAYYNLASFTCPWWSDSLEIPPDLADAGLNAARKLVELREVHRFDPIKIAGGYWILAAHYMYTQKDVTIATTYFDKAKDLAKSVPDDKLSYLLVANSIEGKGRAMMLLNNDPSGKELIKQAIEIYEDNEDDYSKGEAVLFLNNQEL